MSANVLLNLLNKLGNEIKMRGLPSILLLFYNEFKKYNKSGALMLDSFYNTLKLCFWRVTHKIFCCVTFMTLPYILKLAMTIII